MEVDEEYYQEGRKCSSENCVGLEPSGYEEERKTKEDLEEVSYGRGTERRKDVEGGKRLAADRGR
jgi:hypothetical protein